MQPNTFIIFRGDAKTMYLKALQGRCGNLDPVNLTSCTDIDIALPNADGSFTHLTLLGGEVFISAPAVLGKFSVNITELVSALLNVGEFQNFDVTFTLGGQVITAPYPQALSVFERG